MGAAVVADASGGGVGDREGARCSWLRGGSTVERSGGGMEEGEGRGGWVLVLVAAGRWAPPGAWVAGESFPSEDEC